MRSIWLSQHSGTAKDDSEGSGRQFGCEKMSWYLDNGGHRKSRSLDRGSLVVVFGYAAGEYIQMQMGFMPCYVKLRRSGSLEKG
jgi:hypothetical protein